MQVRLPPVAENALSILILACVVAIVIATGWPLVARLGDATHPLDRLYQSALIGMLFHGGCAVMLAGIGVFSLALHSMCAVVFVGATGWWAWRGPGMQWPSWALVRPMRWETAAMGVVLLVTLLLNGTPAQVIFGGRDAGIYANTGFAIARTGSIVQHDAIVADLATRRTTDADAAQGWSNLLGVQSADRFMSTRMRLAGLFISESNASEGAYTPQFLHLFPAWIALFTAAFGVQMGLLATGLAGLMGVWGLGMAGRALFGPAVGIIAMTLLALNGVQVWFSRYPMSETTAQWLFFAMVYALVRYSSPARPDRNLAALLLGLAGGQFLLARLDFVFVLVPFVGWLGWQWLRNTDHAGFRWVVWGFAGTGLHGLVHLLTLSRGYFIDTFFARLQDTALSALFVFPLLTPNLQRIFLIRPCSPLTYQPCPNQSIPDAAWNYPRIGFELACVVLVIVGALWVRRQPDLLARVRAFSRPLLLPLSRVGAVVLGIAVMYAYVIRPQILTPTVVADAFGCLTSTQRVHPTGSCLALQGYIGAPIRPPTYADPVAQLIARIGAAVRGVPLSDPAPLRDLYANSMANLVRVGWYISPFGIEMTFIGLVLLLWRGVNRHNWFFLGVTLVTAFVFIQLSYGTSSQTYIYIMRRYLPNIYPGFALLSAYGAVALWGTAWWRRLLSAGSVAVLVLFLGATIRPVIAVPELQGSFALVERIAALSSPADITLVRGGSPRYVAARDAADTLALPLISIHGQQVFGLRSERPEKYGRDLVTLFRRWKSEGRAVYALVGANGALWFPGMHFVKKEYIQARIPEFSQLLNQKPALIDSLNISYQRYELVDGTAPLPASIDATDTSAQVRGFYPVETIDNRTFAWVEPTSEIRLPLPRAGARVIVRLNSGLRPDGSVPEVCVRLAGQPLPWSNTEPIWTAPICNPIHDHDEPMLLTVPAGMTSATDTLLVRIDTPGWVPALADAALNDFRTLGVQFVSAQVRE